MPLYTPKLALPAGQGLDVDAPILGQRKGGLRPFFAQRFYLIDVLVPFVVAFIDLPFGVFMGQTRRTALRGRREG